MLRYRSFPLHIALLSIGGLLCKGIFLSDLYRHSYFGGVSQTGSSNVTWDYNGTLSYSQDSNAQLTNSQDSTERSYHLRLPTGMQKPQAGWPAVIMFHGYGADAHLLALYTTQFQRKALEQGYVLAYLDGTEQPEVNTSKSGYRYWNTGSAAGPLHEPHTYIDDVNFTASVLQELVDNFEVDPERIFLAGISNGGSMVIRMACEMPHLFAAAMASQGSLEFRNGETCGMNCDNWGNCDWATNRSGCRDEDWVQNLPPIFDCSALLTQRIPFALVNGIMESEYITSHGYVYLPPNGDEPKYLYPPLSYLQNYLTSGYDCGEPYQTFFNGTEGDYSACRSFQNCSVTICESFAGDDWYGESYNKTEYCMYEDSSQNCNDQAMIHKFGPSTDTISLSDFTLDFFRKAVHQ